MQLLIIIKVSIKAIKPQQEYINDHYVKHKVPDYLSEIPVALQPIRLQIYFCSGAMQKSRGIQEAGCSCHELLLSDICPQASDI